MHHLHVHIYILEHVTGYYVFIYCDITLKFWDCIVIA